MRGSRGCGSLVVVGTGIKLVEQATLEAISRIRSADIVLYMVAEAASEAWLRQLNPNCESLYRFYAEKKPRDKSYREMAARILHLVRRGMKVCAAFYGHPGVFVNPAHAALRQAREEGFAAEMLPGISAVDCLYADLAVDPADAGSQTFEATDFLVNARKFDPASALILWQVGVIGQRGIRQQRARVVRSLAFLQGVLLKAYPTEHVAILYEAAQFPICDPSIRRVPICSLAQAEVSMLCTLYVPPLPSPPPDRDILLQLGMISRRPGPPADSRPRRAPRR